MTTESIWKSNGESIYQWVHFRGPQGIKPYVRALRRFGWEQHLTDKVFIGDLEKPQIEEILGALKKVDPDGFEVEMSL